MGRKRSKKAERRVLRSAGSPHTPTAQRAAQLLPLATASVEQVQRDPHGDVYTAVLEIERRAVLEILSEGTTEQQVVEVARNAHGWAQTLIDQARERLPADRQLSCRAGCAFCCFMPTVVSPPEAFRLAAYLKGTRSAEALTTLTAQLRARVAARHGWSTEARWRQKRACVFLQEQQCSVYEHRPLACRAWTSRSAAHCEQALRDETLVGQQDDGILLLGHSVSAGIESACMDLSLDGQRYELEAAVLRALEVIGEPEQESAWASGEAIFGSCDTLHAEDLTAPRQIWRDRG